MRKWTKFFASALDITSSVNLNKKARSHWLAICYLIGNQEGFGKGKSHDISQGECRRLINKICFCGKKYVGELKYVQTAKVY